MMKVIVNGWELPAETVAAYMDAEIRERLIREKWFDSEQDFVDAYCEAHMEKYGEEFIIN